MPRGFLSLLLIALAACPTTPAWAAGDATDFRLEQAGTLRLPAAAEAGAKTPLTGLSGLAWLGGDRWVAAVDNSDQVAMFRLTIGPNGEPVEVSDTVVQRLPARHDFEDVALCPPQLERALAAMVAVPPPAPPPWLLLCEEDTPAIRVVALADGREWGSVAVPAAFRSRRPNRGLESVAIDAQGGCIWTATEEALPADGPAAGAGIGTVVRLTRLAMTTSTAAPPAVRQFAYAVDPPHEAVQVAKGDSLSGVVAIVALGDERLVVLERSFVTGLPPFDSRIYAVDTRLAPDISGVAEGLAARPAASRVTKHLLWQGAVGANLEGLALGPPLGIGGRSLVAIADNGGTNVPTLLVTFRLTGPGPITSP